jgi:uncharacterized protein
MNDPVLPQFAPPAWLRGPHGQTIFPAYAPCRVAHHPAGRHLLDLDDGDQIIVYEDEISDQPPRQIALLLHGLTGSARSPYILRVAPKLRERGFHVVRVDLRGHGEGRDLAKKPGHAGRSEDVACVVRHLAARHDSVDIHLVGVSLSGNIILKLLGELALANDVLLDRIKSAVAISPPIDLVASAEYMLGRQGRLYTRAFVRKLTKIVRERIRRGDLSLDLLKPLPKTLWDFDNQVTAPLSGFQGADEYYTLCSSTRVLDQIPIPTLVIAALDDPIVPGEIFRRAFPPNFTLCLPKHGGHVGFYAGKTNDRDRYWMDWRVVDWLAQE